MNETRTILQEPSQLVLENTQPPSVIRLSLRARVVLWLYGFALPLICFAVATATDDIGVDQPWQSGDTGTYALMLLRPSAWLPFVPWLLISLVSFAYWTYQPRAAQKPWVRVGLYSGVILSVQYWIVILVSHGLVTLVATVFVLPAVFAVSIITASIVVHYKRFQIWHIMVLTAVIAVVVVAIRVAPSHIREIPFAVPLYVLAAAPTLNLIAYVQAALFVSRIDRSQPAKLRWLLGTITGWTVGWLVSWRFAVQAMLDEYSRLPTTNPNCYFANASARAHVWLGGQRRTLDAYQAHSVTCVGRNATLTMKRLKFLELALLSTAPRTHRLVRRHYDRWGEPAARYCSQHYWFANLTCLALKPVEVLAEIVRIAAGVSKASMAAIYATERNQEEKS